MATAVSRRCDRTTGGVGVGAGGATKTAFTTGALSEPPGVSIPNKPSIATTTAASANAAAREASTTLSRSLKSPLRYGIAAIDCQPPAFHRRVLSRARNPAK